MRTTRYSHSRVRLEQDGRVPDLGYVVDRAPYHPGDALHVPDVPVETLLVPLQAPGLNRRDAAEPRALLVADQVVYDRVSPPPLHASRLLAGDHV